jgi:hypothetical protein
LHNVGRTRDESLAAGDYLTTSKENVNKAALLKAMSFT